MKKPSKFTGYTAEDCSCQYCLHYQGRSKPCLLETCCCAEEKREALKRLPAQGKTFPERLLRGAAGVIG